MSAIQRTIPLLVYDDIEAAYDFLVDVFGFGPGGVQRDGQGLVVHGEVTAGDVVLWLHRVSPEHEMASPSTMDAQSGGLVVHVKDVDAHYKHARDAGARIDSEPTDQEYGQREYGVRDPEGHRWWFATPLT
jgi:MerR family transcriptional regulator, thiopeptide resistance regulator